MTTSNLFYELIDLKSALKKDIELFKVTVDLNSKSIIQHQLVRIETDPNPSLQRRNQLLITKYIGDQLISLTPHIVYPACKVSESNWRFRLTEHFIASGQPRIIPAVIGDCHFKDDFITNYFEGVVSDISVSFIPTVSPSATQNKLLVGVTATLFIKKIETNSNEPVDIGFISRKEVDVDDNLFMMDMLDNSPNIVDYYDICFSGLTELIEHNQILRKKIIEELTKFI